jgi:predicted nucleotidyltransferase
MATAAIEDALREPLAAEPDEMIAAYLFGSVAHGTAGARSDVAVAVLYVKAPPATIEGLPLDLESPMSRLLGRPAQSDERLGEPETDRELFDRLAQHGWLPAELAATMARMAAFRNIVVDGYGGVNLDIARDIVEHRLGDLLAFVTTIRGRLRQAE